MDWAYGLQKKTRNMLAAAPRLLSAFFIAVLSSNTYHAEQCPDSIKARGLED